MRRLLQGWLRRALRRLDPPAPLEVVVNRYRIMNGLADALVEDVERVADYDEWKYAQAALGDGDAIPALDLLFRDCARQFDVCLAAPVPGSGEGES